MGHMETSTTMLDDNDKQCWTQCLGPNIACRHWEFSSYSTTLCSAYLWVQPAVEMPITSWWSQVTVVTEPHSWVDLRIIISSTTTQHSKVEIFFVYPRFRKSMCLSLNATTVHSCWWRRTDVLESSMLLPSLWVMVNCLIFNNYQVLFHEHDTVFHINLSVNASYFHHLLYTAFRYE